MALKKQQESTENPTENVEIEQEGCTSEEQDGQTEKCPSEVQSEECTSESTESLIEFADDLMNYINKKYETKCRDITRFNQKSKVIDSMVPKVFINTISHLLVKNFGYFYQIVIGCFQLKVSKLSFNNLNLQKG